MKSVVCSCILLTLIPRVQADDALVPRSSWTTEKIAATFRLAKSQPDELWKLRTAPLEMTFNRLMRVWLDAGGDRWSEILATDPYDEQQWAKIEKQIGRELSASEKQSIIARRILNAHDQFRACVHPRVQRLCTLFQKRLKMGKRASKSEFIAARTEAIELLKLALIRRDWDGIEIITAFLGCSDELDPAQDKMRETSPPRWALWAFTERVKDVEKTQATSSSSLQLPIPIDLEGARQWLGRNAFVLSGFPEPWPLPKWPDERIAEIAERSTGSPSALRELQEAPIEKAFDVLMKAWLDGVEPGAQQEQGQYETKQERSRVARLMLAEHSGVEGILDKRLERISKILDQWQKRKKRVDEKEFAAIRKESMELLDLAVLRKCNDGYRAIGSFLATPDSMTVFPRLSGATAPAEWARAALAKRVSQRWDEKIPDDISGARGWWAENKQRFEGSSPQPIPASPGAKGIHFTDRAFYPAQRASDFAGLREYIAEIEAATTRYFSEVDKPEYVFVVGGVKSGNRSKFEVQSFDGKQFVDLNEQLQRVKPPEVGLDSIAFILPGVVAGGFRHERDPDSIQCGVMDWGSGLRGFLDSWK